MISIRKYLDSGRSGSRLETREVPGEDLLKFSTGALECIDRHILVGDSFEPLRSRLAELRGALRTDLGRDEAAQAAQSVSSVLEQYRTAVQQIATNQAIEVQHIFAMLNQALITLAEGSGRSVARLSQIQESLQKTSLMQDIVALKASLAETVQFVRNESTQAREAASEELKRFETEVSKAREFLGKTRMELAGRPEGVRKIAESLRHGTPDQALYVVTYMFERLQAVAQRYGPTVADELVFRLIKERIQPVAPAEAQYLWTPSSLMVAFRRPRNLERLRIEVANLNRTPVVHRIALGNRTAVLTVTPSHLVLEGNGESPALLVEQVDRFTGVAA